MERRVPIVSACKRGKFLSLATPTLPNHTLLVKLYLLGCVIVHAIGAYKQHVAVGNSLSC